MIACLFVLKDSVYKKFDYCDCYDIDRDAMMYIGEHPVVAHPPCNLWGKFAAVNYARYGGEHNRPGNDGGMFEFALSAVRRCGGVLEHPAGSKAWDHYNIPKSKKPGWMRVGEFEWVCEVWQSAYGHKANKATRLFYCGKNLPMPALWNRPIGSHQVGYRDQRGKKANKPTLSKKEAKSTPILFAKYLTSLAWHSQKTKGFIGGKVF